jgi:hypothetical protein
MFCVGSTWWLRITPAEEAAVRVLSVSQPWAQLIVRGMKVRELRSWGSDFRGRIAIHAGSKAPPFDVVAEAARDVELAAWFDYQGWRSREHLLALPLSAIIGTIDVTNVQQTALGAAGDETSEWTWMLDDPVEIDAVNGIAGKQRLWTLDDDVSRDVMHRERVQRAILREVAALPGRKSRQHDLRGDAVVARFVRRLERREKRVRGMLKQLPNIQLERSFVRLFSAYCAANRLEGLRPAFELIRIAGPMCRVVDEKVLPRFVLELRLREELASVAWHEFFEYPPREGILDWAMFNEHGPDEIPEPLERPAYLGKVDDAYFYRFDDEDEFDVEEDEEGGGDSPEEDDEQDSAA